MSLLPLHSADDGPEAPERGAAAGAARGSAPASPRPSEMKMKTNDACILLGRSDTASNRVRILHDDAVASAGGRTRTAQLTESLGVGSDRCA